MPKDKIKIKVGPSNKEVEGVLRKILIKEGYRLSRQRKNGETGVDILAIRGRKKYYIEVIGYKQSPPQRSRDLYEVFFRSISRLTIGAKICVIALPAEFKRGWGKRKELYAIAWKRIDRVFPELKIWFVDTNDKTFEHCSDF